jgi:iron complex outermembrane receptor protein
VVRTANSLSPRTWLVGLLLACCLATPVHGQQSGQIIGSVRDQAGDPLPGVSVTVSGPQSRATSTDSSGVFEIGNLPAGTYQVSASSSGFATVHRNVRLEPAESLSLSVTLQVALLEQVLVTATKAGAADVQAVPIAVSALSNHELTRLPLRSLDQVAPSLPSVTFTQNSTFGQLSIRGIGGTIVNAGGDPSSALYVDGVYLARPAMTFIDFLDLDRVEALRGPQGTLYGRNAVGGAIHLISKAPTNDLDASVRVTAGNLAAVRTDARVSGPLKRDRVMGSVAFAKGIRDGYVRDLDHPDHRLGVDDVTAARGQLRAIFNPRNDLLISADVSDQSGTPLTYNKVLEVKPGFQVNNPPSLYDVRTSTPASAQVLQSGASVRFISALTPSTTFVSLTAFRQLDNEYLVDADITELDLFDAHIHERQHQWSEEATLTHRQRRITSIVGTFLFAERDNQRIEADLLQAGTRTFLDPRVDASSVAAFGQTTIDVTSALSATAGVRYSRERKTIDNVGARYTLDGMQLLPDSGYAYTDAILHGAWTPKFGVELKLPRQSIAYVSATKGFKSGGFNASSTQAGRGFAPEWAWNYEGGIKTPLLNGRARLNVAAFDMKYTNLQVQTPIGIGVFDIRNAAAATITGVELESTVQLGRGFEAGGHVSSLDATYDQYVAVGMGGIVEDVAGRRLNNAPRWSGRLWTEWTGTLTATHQLSLAIDATAQSTVYYTPFNDTIQRQLPYGLVGARAEYGPTHKHWSIDAYVKNLTGTEYVMATFATSPAAYGGRPGASREIGVQFVVRK